jgi:CrcB protein
MPDPELSTATRVDPFSRRPPRRRSAKQLGPVLAVAVGGALGGSARYAVGEALPPDERGIPCATLTVNVSGAFVLAVLLVLVLDLWPPRRYVRPFVATGFLGAYTTFSSLAVEVDQRLSDGAFRTASLYLALTLVAGLGAAWLGLLLGYSVVRRRASDRPHRQHHDKLPDQEEEAR